MKNNQNITWLIQKPLTVENLDPLIAEIAAQGMQSKVIPYFPFSDTDYKSMLPEDNLVICYGCIQMIEKIQRVIDWDPGPWCNQENMKFSTFASNLPSNILINNDFSILPLRNLLDRFEDYLRDFECGNNIFFVRPNSSRKQFDGAIYDLKDFSAVYDQLINYGIPKDLLCVIAKPKDIVKEWRFVIADHKVVAGCQYRRNSTLEVKKDYPIDAFEIAKRVAENEWQPDPMYVVDVGMDLIDESLDDVDEYRFGVIEINSFSCSGFYECDVKEIVKAARDLAESKQAAKELALKDVQVSVKKI